jgi:dsDNA-specific endonuclease/ATPase MutS2
VIREITQDTGSVLLVEPQSPVSLANGILTLLQNEDERISRGNLGRTLVLSKYDRQKITLDLLANISTVINIDKKES